MNEFERIAWNSISQTTGRLRQPDRECAFHFFKYGCIKFSRAYRARPAFFSRIVPVQAYSTVFCPFGISRTNKLSPGIASDLLERLLIPPVYTVTSRRYCSCAHVSGIEEENQIAFAARPARQSGTQNPRVKSYFHHSRYGVGSARGASVAAPEAAITSDSISERAPNDDTEKGCHRENPLTMTSCLQVNSVVWKATSPRASL